MIRAVAITLLLAVFIRHESAYWLAEATGFTPVGMNRILGGAYEVVLAGVIALFLLAAKRTPWRDLGLAAMAIAALEGTQIAVCRALVTDIKAVPPNMNTCDWLIGVFFIPAPIPEGGVHIPFGHIMMSLYAIIIAGSLAHARAR